MISCGNCIVRQIHGMHCLICGYSPQRNRRSLRRSGSICLGPLGVRFRSIFSCVFCAALLLDDQIRDVVGGSAGSCRRHGALPLCLGIAFRLLGRQVLKVIDLDN